MAITQLLTFPRRQRKKKKESGSIKRKHHHRSTKFGNNKDSFLSIFRRVALAAFNDSSLGFIADIFFLFVDVSLVSVSVILFGSGTEAICEMRQLTY